MIEQLKRYTWNLTKDGHPPTGLIVLGSYGRDYDLVLWHGSMGDGGKGDFATIIRGKRTTKLIHCPGIRMWAEIPAFDAVTATPAPVVITDEMVDRALIAWYGVPYPTTADSPLRDRADMRAALVAAFGGKS